jgi:hypothetical protein
VSDTTMLGIVPPQEKNIYYYWLQLVAELNNKHYGKKNKVWAHPVIAA